MTTLGYDVLESMFDDIQKHTGKPPIVVDAKLLMTYPEQMLRKLCEALGIEFCKEQLYWPPGPKPDIDG